ncbi:MAG TPA: response regulator transcription factor [bacterium]|nr:response regulator transcription factor [bacterium]
MSRTRTLIVDDSELARRGIRAILKESPLFEVVGEANDGAMGIARVRELAPDLVLMDLRMPGLSGLEATRTIKEEFPATLVVVLSVSDDPQDLFEAIRCGAQGYLIKPVGPGLWLEYLTAVVQGDARISRAVAERILEEFTRQSSVPRVALPTLTPREEEVLALVARGMANKEIAATLAIVEGTVKRHLQNILAKLHLRNRVELAAFAITQGYAAPASLRQRRPRQP